MDTVITFTPAELVAFVTAIGGAVVTVGAVATLIFKIVNRLRAPEIKQDERIKALEDKYSKIEEQNKLFTQYFINDNKRFNALEKSNQAILSTLRALLKHAINGNDREQLEDAEADLDRYLINRKQEE